MILSMPAQAWLFVATVVVGGAVGVFYDFFRVLRRTAPHGKWAVQLEDLFFWLAVTVLVFYYMLHRNYGEIRFFALLGMGLGVTLYFVTVSRIIIWVSVAVVEYIKKVVAAVFRIILLPLRLLLAFAAPPAKKAGQFVHKRLRGIRRYGRMKARKTVRNWAVIRKKV
ncbi:MAG: spore cortex biosynthesis protein YabQ [Defluviitaleaceae bacterium]|nr:spore cortex biosynthesis protein YabQ [Defluviitaleaceae bacterium]